MAAETLLLDIGNTRIKWALLSKRQRGAANALAHRDRNLTEILDERWQDLHPNLTVACSVAPAATERQLTDWIMANWGINPFFFTSEHAFPGMRIGYPNPAEMGNDRWLAAIAAFQHCRQAVAIVDAGTAITIDLVDSGGHHRGGWILPGLETMSRCLMEKTAIPARSTVSELLTEGTSTMECIGNGAMLACIGAIERAAAIPEWQDCRWLLTGGDAERLSPQLNMNHEYMENLLLDGLELVANQKSGQS